MLKIAKLPLARRLWKVCKQLHVPIHDPRISNMDTFDLEFYEFSILCDNPKALEAYENRYFDPEFEEWLDEFDKEQESAQQNSQLDLPDVDTIKYANNNSKSEDSTDSILDDYEIGDSTQINENDWVAF